MTVDKPALTEDYGEIVQGYHDPVSGLPCAWACGGRCFVPSCAFPDERCYCVPPSRARLSRGGRDPADRRRPVSAVARNVHLLSADCRSAYHSSCSGRRFVGTDGRGSIYARCQCSCHRTEADSPPTPESESMRREREQHEDWDSE